MLGCRPGPALRRRMALGIGLYRAGAAPLLLLSGRGEGAVAEAAVMRDLALAEGVPAASVLIESDSRDTLGNARECARLLRARGLSAVLLVSDRAHLPRAILLFRLAGLRVRGHAGAPASTRRRALAAALREAAALPGSVLRALLDRLRGR